MEQQWGIKNLSGFGRFWLDPPSREQFITLTTEFRRAMEAFTGEPCLLVIQTMDSVPTYSKYQLSQPGVQRAMDDDNARHLRFATGDLSDITPARWKDAKYVNVTVGPAAASKDGIYGRAEFLGPHPGAIEATFHVHAEGTGQSPQAFFATRYPAKVMTSGEGDHRWEITRVPDMGF